MGMRVQENLLIPGMQDHRDAELGLQAAPSKRTECCGRAGKEQPKHHRRSEGRKRTQLGGHGKNHVKVWNIEQTLSLLVDPLLLRERLTLGTMPIATRVVGGVLETAALTDIEMSAERGGAAPNNIRQHPALSRAETDGLLESYPLASDDIGKVEVWRPSPGRHGLAPARLR